MRMWAALVILVLVIRKGLVHTNIEVIKEDGKVNHKEDEKAANEYFVKGAVAVFILRHGNHRNKPKQGRYEHEAAVGRPRLVL